MKKVLQIKNLNKSFGKNVLFKNLNFSVEEGSRIALIGENGTGKSTLVNIIAGVNNYQSGEILFPLDGSREEFSKTLGIQFQNIQFPKGFKVKTVLDVVFDIQMRDKVENKREWRKVEASQREDELLKVFKLDGFKNRKVQKLSGGERQRLNVVLSLLSKPKFLILDEITTGLDIEGQETILKYIKNYVEENKVTLIVISHIQKEIEMLADTVAIIGNKKIAYVKSIKDIKAKFGNLDKFLNLYFTVSHNVIKPGYKVKKGSK